MSVHNNMVSERYDSDDRRLAGGRDEVSNLDDFEVSQGLEYNLDPLNEFFEGLEDEFAPLERLEMAIKGKIIHSFKITSMNEIYEKWDKRVCEFCDEQLEETELSGHDCSQNGFSILILNQGKDDEVMAIVYHETEENDVEEVTEKELTVEDLVKIDVVLDEQCEGNQVQLPDLDTTTQNKKDQRKKKKKKKKKRRVVLGRLPENCEPRQGEDRWWNAWMLWKRRGRKRGISWVNGGSGGGPGGGPGRLASGVRGIEKRKRRLREEQNIVVTGEHGDDDLGGGSVKEAKCHGVPRGIDLTIEGRWCSWKMPRKRSRKKVQGLSCSSGGGPGCTRKPGGGSRGVAGRVCAWLEVIKVLNLRKQGEEQKEEKTAKKVGRSKIAGKLLGLAGERGDGAVKFWMVDGGLGFSWVEKREGGDEELWEFTGKEAAGGVKQVVDALGVEEDEASEFVDKHKRKRVTHEMCAWDNPFSVVMGKSGNDVIKIFEIFSEQCDHGVRVFNGSKRSPLLPLIELNRKQGKVVGIDNFMQKETNLMPAVPHLAKQISSLYESILYFLSTSLNFGHSLDPCVTTSGRLLNFANQPICLYPSPFLIRPATYTTQSIPYFHSFNFLGHLLNNTFSENIHLYTNFFNFLPNPTCLTISDYHSNDDFNSGEENQGTQEKGLRNREEGNKANDDRNDVTNLVFCLLLHDFQCLQRIAKSTLLLGLFKSDNLFPTYTEGYHAIVSLASFVDGHYKTHLEEICGTRFSNFSMGSFTWVADRSKLSTCHGMTVVSHFKEFPKPTPSSDIRFQANFHPP